MHLLVRMKHSAFMRFGDLETWTRAVRQNDGLAASVRPPGGSGTAQKSRIMIG